MTTDDIIRIADGLDQNVQIDPQTSEDEPGGYRSELDELMADAAAILRSQHARIAELKAQLYAVGAGGVGQSIKPQIQADAAQKPVAWIDVKPNPFDPSCRGAASVQDHALPPGEHKLYAAPQPAPAQQEPVGYMRWKNGSAEYVTRKHLEHPDDEDWHAVYTAPKPARQPLPPASPCPLTEDGYNIFKLGWRESEAAHGITGSQQ